MSIDIMAIADFLAMLFGTICGLMIVCTPSTLKSARRADDSRNADGADQ